MIGGHNINSISTYCIIFSFEELITIHRIINEKFAKLYREYETRKESRRKGMIVDTLPDEEYYKVKKIHDEMGDIFVEEDVG